MAGETRPTIGEILERVDLAALMDHLIPVAIGAGHRRRWQCPDRGHDDVHPSTTISRPGRDGHQRWRCWSGGHGGDAVDLVAHVHGLDTITAVEWLASHAGVLTPAARRVRSTPVPPAANEPAASMLRYLRICEAVLWGANGAATRDWLTARGLHEPGSRRRTDV